MKTDLPDMITHEEALRLIRSRVGPLGAEQAPIAESAGRILAEDVVAGIASPPFNKSAMDGFAVRAADVAAPPVELALVGESFAGQWPAFEVGPGQCARITTGAPVPAGADMVVMVEHTREMPGRVVIKELSGANICLAGEDVAEGAVVLRAGESLTALKVGVAAGAGHAVLNVYRRPSAALVCTGSEVLEPGSPVGKGRIYNSNAYILSALLTPLCGSLEYLGIVEDRPRELEEAFARGLERDVFVITGGVSMGQYDLVPRVLEKLGVETVFHKVAVKPGKPVLFGVRGGACVFGLPGNPLSCFVSFHVLMRAAFALMSGAGSLPPSYRTGVMAHSFGNKGDRKTFRPCRVSTRDGANVIELVDSRGAADIMGASAANAFVVIPQGVAQVQEGRVMEFFEV